jgi:glycosyltransferase involved in cell wall biosynthesis
MERLKARLQRIGYAKAYRNAAMMIYISGHLRDLYRRGNVGVPETRSEIAWVGLNEDTYQAARDLQGIEREPFSIVSVSAMAPWKGAETLVEAVRLLRARQIPAVLKLVGPWPNAAYEQTVEDQIQRHSLADSVRILGKVSNDELHRLYATSQVFSLMSSCESFGIPAAEAMAFGTPVVSTNCCAIAEICEPAGQFGPVDDPEWTAKALEKALTDRAAWENWSHAARQRAAMLTWENCAKPFQRIPELVQGADRVREAGPNRD